MESARMTSADRRWVINEVFSFFFFATGPEDEDDEDDDEDDEKDHDDDIYIMVECMSQKSLFPKLEYPLPS